MASSSIHNNNNNNQNDQYRGHHDQFDRSIYNSTPFEQQQHLQLQQPINSSAPLLLREDVIERSSGGRMWDTDQLSKPNGKKKPATLKEIEEGKNWVHQQQKQEQQQQHHQPYSKSDAFLFSLDHFSRQTTLHGVKHVSMSPYRLKKMLWILLVLGSAVTMIVQLKEKLGSYLKKPYTLDMTVTYEPVMEFPAVVICNANLFRISETTKQGMYEVITDVYNESRTVGQRISAEKYPQLKRINGREFVEKSAHQLEDMLLFCRWPNGSDCTGRDFRRIPTDYGVCYGINTLNHRVATVDNPGFGYGLYLIINTENYEAMPGRQRTLGIKVLIYNQSDIPLVAEHGFDVAPGYQTSVGLKYTKSKKLNSEEGGQCDEVKLTFFPHETYNRKLCVVDHKYLQAIGKCHCLSYNMPKLNITQYTECDAAQYFSCMTSAIEESVNLTTKQCPQHCEYFEYQQYISFSELSANRVDNIVQNAPPTVWNGKRSRKKVDQILENYMEAQEARSRNSKAQKEADERIVTNLLSVHDDIYNKSLSPGTTVSEAVDGLINTRIPCFNETIQVFLEGNTFCNKDLLNSYSETAGNVFYDLAQLKAEPTTIGRDLKDLGDKMNVSLRDLNRLIDDIDKHYEMWANAAESERARVVRWVKEEIFIDSLRSHLKDVHGRSLEHPKKFGEISTVLMAFLVVTQNITNGNFRQLSAGIRQESENVTGCLGSGFPQFTLPDDEDGVSIVSMDALEALRDTLGQTHDEWRECTGSVGMINEHWDKFDTMVSQFQKNYTKLVESMEATCKQFDAVKVLNGDILAGVISGRDVSDDNLGAEEYDTVYQEILSFMSVAHSKAEFARNLLALSPKFPGSVKLHFDRIKNRATEINDVCQDTRDGIEMLIESIQENKFKELVQLIYPTALNDSMVELPRRLKAMNECLPIIIDEMNELETEAPTLADLYEKSFNSLRDHLKEYNQSLKISPHFYKDNLLAVNIYVREMSIEKLEQQLSYNFFSLLSDIGGTLGLFLGASLLTLAEIIDYLLGEMLYACGYKSKSRGLDWSRRRRRRHRPLSSSNNTTTDDDQMETSFPFSSHHVQQQQFHTTISEEEEEEKEEEEDRVCSSCRMTTNKRHSSTTAAAGATTNLIMTTASKTRPTTAANIPEATTKDTTTGKSRLLQTRRKPFNTKNGQQEIVTTPNGYLLSNSFNNWGVATATTTASTSTTTSSPSSSPPSISNSINHNLSIYDNDDGDDSLSREHRGNAAAIAQSETSLSLTSLSKQQQQKQSASSINIMQQQSILCITNPHHQNDDNDDDERIAMLMINKSSTPTHIHGENRQPSSASSSSSSGQQQQQQQQHQQRRIRTVF